MPDMHPAIEAVTWLPSWFMLAILWHVMAVLTIGNK